jgi:uroporphyrinogen decarboxylase
MPSDIGYLLMQKDQRLVAPLAATPGVQLIGHTLQACLQDHSLHIQAISALQEVIRADLAFTLMDLTVEAEAVGCSVRFEPQRAPVVTSHPADSQSSLKRLRIPDPYSDGRLPLFLDTVSALSRQLPMPVGAYVIGPFTLAGQMAGVTAVAEKSILDQESAESLLDFAVAAGVAYSRALVKAGAALVAVLEPTAVILSPRSFTHLVLPRLHRLFEAIKSAGAFPVLHICGKSTHLLSAMTQTGAHGLSLDSVVSFPDIATQVPPEIALIGNLAPVDVIMQGSQQDVINATRRLLDAMEPYPNFILSSGCDLPLETPLDNIRSLVQVAKSPHAVQQMAGSTSGTIRPSNRRML